MRLESSLVGWGLVLCIALQAGCGDAAGSAPAGSGGASGAIGGGAGVAGEGDPVAGEGGASGAAGASGGMNTPPPLDDAAAPGPNEVDSGVAPLDDDEFLGLAPPSSGFRVASIGREIAPDQDVEYCEVAELPGSPEQEYIASGFEVANGLGSHHIIISAAKPGSPADAKLRARRVGDQIPCIAAATQFGGDGLFSVIASQTSYGRSDFPEGVGVRLYGGQRIVFDYHYLNTSAEPIEAKSALAVHTKPASEDLTIAAGFSFSNMTIDTPPGTARTFTASCMLEHDAMVMGVGRHTHAYGTDFTVWFEGGARHGEHIWTSDDWEHDLALSFPEPVLVKAGHGFKFACSFMNDRHAPLRFGTSATDEMCILAGTIWSPTPGAELDDETCVISWIDQDGVGHDARDAGGFPPATPEDALSCHAGFLGLGFFEGCVGCICDSCGTIMNKCNADADCRPLLECTSGCMGDCMGSCDDEMSAHSSAVGMIAQVGECLSAQCGASCSIGTQATATP